MKCVMDLFFRCKGLILMETYTTKSPDEVHLPDFLEIVKEVTHDPHYSMFNLSLKDSLGGSPNRLKSLPNSFPNHDDFPLVDGVDK